MRATPLASTSTLPDVRSVAWTQPFNWLARGFSDIARAPLASLAHGVAAAAFGAVLLVVARDKFWWLVGAFSAFLIVAPVVATGLYALSRALERNEPASLHTVWQVWTSMDRRLMSFGWLLALAGFGWVLTSAALITLFAPAPILTPADFIRHVVLARDSWLFEVWLALGGLMAAPMFASSVVAIPLLLDRPVSVLQAVLTSWRAVLDNPATMALWAALLMSLSLLGIATWMACLTLAVPLAGHASWHAYKDLVSE